MDGIEAPARELDPEELRVAATAAIRRGHYAEAASRWAELRQKRPDDLTACLGEVSALRGHRRFVEAEALLSKYLARFPENHALLIEQATLAHLQAKAADAARLWGRLSELIPGSDNILIASAKACLSDARPTEADAVLERAIAQYPDRPALHEAYADLAARRNDWPLAEQRWRLACRNFPNRSSAFLGLIDALNRLRRYEEAEGLVADALSMNRGNAEYWEASARISESQERWLEAEQRWGAVILRFPDNVGGWHRTIMVRLKLGDSKEAEMLAGVAADRFPDNLAILQAHALAAVACEDWSVAEARWDAVRALSLNQPDPWIQQARAMCKQGARDRAEALLSQAIEHLPGILSIEIELAQMATDNHDWAVAQRRWASLAQRAKNDTNIQARAFEAAMAVAGSGNAAEVEDVRAPALGIESPYDVVMQFESIGNNCEFGLMQRHFGAEPLSLFRWSSTRVPPLIKAFSMRLEGVGEPENTTIDATVTGEYMTRDIRYEFAMHTFIKTEAVDRERFFIQQCRRLQYLKRKLVEDLQSAEKTFVFKTYQPESTDNLLRLHKAISDIGPARLLFVQNQDDEHPNGEIVELSPRLYIGYLDRITPEGSSWKISYDSWLSLLRNFLGIIGSVPQI